MISGYGRSSHDADRGEKRYEKLEKVLDAFGKFAALYKFDLQGSFFDLEALRIFFERVPRMTGSIYTLNLRSAFSVNHSDQGLSCVQYIAGNASLLSSLQTLVLAGNLVHDAGAIAIASSAAKTSSS